MTITDLWCTAVTESLSHSSIAWMNLEYWANKNALRYAKRTKSSWWMTDASSLKQTFSTVETVRIQICSQQPAQHCEQIAFHRQPTKWHHKGSAAAGVSSDRMSIDSRSYSQPELFQPSSFKVQMFFLQICIQTPRHKHTNLDYRCLLLIYWIISVKEEKGSALI